MRKIIIYVSLALLSIILIIIVVESFNSLRKPCENIRENLLELTPIGMSMEEIVELVESNKWSIRYVSDEFGVSYGSLGYPSKPEDVALNRPTVIGEKSIRATIGTYTTFFKTTVVVWWAFDENSHLIEVYVSKDIDGF